MSHVKQANPASLGLMGFGMATVLLNLHNAGHFPFDIMILAMGFFYGGLAQIFAGIMEYRNGNMFGMTAFTSYGLFWTSLVFIIVMPELSGIESVSDAGMASYLVMWGLFTAILSVSATKFNYAILTVFTTLTVLFFLLAVGVYNPLIHQIAGYEGILCGFTAIYVAFAELTNTVYDRNVIPLWPIKK